MESHFAYFKNKYAHAHAEYVHHIAMDTTFIVDFPGGDGGTPVVVCELSGLGGDALLHIHNWINNI